MKKKNTKICVVGLGYIGLPTACFLAKAGYKVTGVDIDSRKINLLKKQKLPFEEPGLKNLFLKSFSDLSFSNKTLPADVFIICVPTPILNNKKPDLKYVKQAVKSISKVLRDKNLVIVESTIPPGTIKEVAYPLLQKNKVKKFYLSYAPERAIPGKTLKEMSGNPRIIGGIDKESTKLTKDLYLSFIKGRIWLTDATTAEAVKLIENTYRDINIAFANELAKLAAKIGINIWQAIKLANLHPRVNIHSPGPGVGGHCIAVDPWFLVRRENIGNKVIKLARDINDSMPNYVIALVRDLVKNIKNPTITILGAAYKADVDDMRETPALRVIKLAKNRSWKIRIHDPLVKKFSYKLERNIRKAAQDSDCLVVITDHKFYKNLNPQVLKMKHKNILDTRNCLNKDKWQKAGFNIKILGR